MFKETHPILGTRDIQRAIEFYTQRLGFQLAFRDKTDPPNYVGFRRDAVELHMQFQLRGALIPKPTKISVTHETRTPSMIGDEK
jgi:catechol 2,3-dioxygenase-like lactoylglutathione lyase family enzyme